MRGHTEGCEDAKVGVSVGADLVRRGGHACGHCKARDQGILAACLTVPHHSTDCTPIHHRDESSERRTVSPL